MGLSHFGDDVCANNGPTRTVAETVGRAEDVSDC